MDNRKIKTILLILLVIGLISMTASFASIVQRLDIRSDTTVQASNWNIRFNNLQNGAVVGTANQVSVPTLADTIISGINVNLKKPGDSISYTFDIVNSGDIDAKIGTYQLSSGLSCTDALGSTTSVDSTTVCNHIIYTLKYTNATQSGIPAGSNIAVGQSLKAGETVNVTLTIKYDSNTTFVPSSVVTVNGLDSYIIYVQD